MRPSPTTSARARRFTEYDVQQWMAGWFTDEGLIADDKPVVASMENAGNPHYMPMAETSRTHRAATSSSCSICGAR